MYICKDKMNLCIYVFSVYCLHNTFESEYEINLFEALYLKNAKNE